MNTFRVWFIQGIYPRRRFQKRDFARFFAPKLVLWWICARIHSFSNLSDSQFIPIRFSDEYSPTMPTTIFGANYFQNQGIHSILRIQKRPYRDVKMKKTGEIWRDNAVGIGLCNECELWWGVRFETLLAALKSKWHKQPQSCFVFVASVWRWAFELMNASGPGIPKT